MIHTTLGIDIGQQSLKYALLHVDGKSVTVEGCGSIPIEPTVLDNGLNATLTQLSDIVLAYKKAPIDAIGMTVDPTRMLSLHRILPFNNDRAIEQTLPSYVMDVWTIDEQSQLAFSVGEFVERKNEGKNEGETEDELSTGGFDVYIINYPKDGLVPLIEQAKNAHVDPHVLLPSTEAMKYAIGPIIDPSEAPWCLIDIGDTMTSLYVIHEGKIVLARPFKLGGANLDSILAETFEMSLSEAREMKEQTGFICTPGAEEKTYQELIDEKRLKPWEVDLETLNKACTRGMNMILTSIRQTLINFVTKNHIEPHTICLTGGGSRLVGLDQWMSEQLNVKCVLDIPRRATFLNGEMEESVSLDAMAIAMAASNNIDSKIALNLRRGALAHKGSLAVIQEKKWLLACLFLAIIGALIFMTVTKSNMIRAEHDNLKAALEKATQEVFGTKMTSYKQIEKKISESKGYSFIPERTAFTHFEWISTQVNDNLSDVEMDLSSLDIDTQRKIVTVKGEVTGDEGLPKFMQQMEQYECFPDEIQEPKTSKVKDRLAFTLRIDANHCGTGDDSE